jgi:LTXXQ motif family protein
MVPPLTMRSGAAARARRIEGCLRKAAEDLKVSCPSYQTLTPTGRVEAMEKRLDATLSAVKTPVPVKFYNSLSHEQKARFNSLRSASRPAG